MYVPQPALILEGSDVKLPFVLIGDQAFSLTDKVLRPYKGHFLRDTKKIFNYRLCRARRFVECAFSILSNKWRIFYRPLDVTKPITKSILKACVVLHNLVREMDGAGNEGLLENGGFMTLPPFAGGPGRNLRSTDATRNAFADYFVSPEVALPWQNNRI